MTKKKSKNQDPQFQPPKPKGHIGNPIGQSINSRNAQRTGKKVIQKKKQQQRIVYNQVKAQQRKIQQQKYRQNLIQRKMDEQKKRFYTLRYDDEMNSQLAQLNQDSIQRRLQNETILKIRQILQTQQLNQNKQRLSKQAQNQYAKVQQFSELINQINDKQKDQYRDDMNQNQHNQKDLLSELHTLFPKENKGNWQQNSSKNVIQKINQLQQIYY